MDWICSWPASPWFWSTSSLTILTAPLASVTAFSSAGPSVLHGPHQGAQKSTITGTSWEAWMTSSMKVASDPSLIRSPAGAALPGFSSSMGASSRALVMAYMRARGSKIKCRKNRRMIRWLFPAARIAQDPRPMRGGGDVAGGPDVIKAAAFIGGVPVFRAVGPP